MKDDPLWLTIAGNEIGVKEMTGVKHDPRILKYHQYTSYEASTDEVPWCSSFVNWVFAMCEIKGTNKATARSWIKWGEPVKKPYRGCLVIMERGTAWQGHVAFVLECDGGTLKVIGGNQSNSVCIRRYSLERVLAFRQPHVDDRVRLSRLSIHDLPKYRKQRRSDLKKTANLYNVATRDELDT